MITAGMLLHAITSGEWHRYDGAPYDTDDNGHTVFYATTGTVGEDAVNLRCALQPPWARTDGDVQPIEYQPVGDDQWYPAGYQAIMRYDTSRDHAEDGDGYEFVPYKVTSLQRITS